MTDIITAMENRHAVRAYDGDRKIEKDKLDIILERIESVNADSGLDIQLVRVEP